MAEEQTPQVNFNVQDIANLVQIVDYAAAQGAFKGWETIRQVMMVRDQAAQFVEAVQAATPVADNPDGTAPTEEANGADS